jgi:hypothetical protein
MSVRLIAVRYVAVALVTVGLVTARLVTVGLVTVGLVTVGLVTVGLVTVGLVTVRLVTVGFLTLFEFTWPFRRLGVPVEVSCPRVVHHAQLDRKSLEVAPDAGKDPQLGKPVPKNERCVFVEACLHSLKP